MTTPSVEFFHADDLFETESGEPMDPGWYYWYCQPGCLPDSEPIGPFDSEALALEDFENEQAELDAMASDY